MKICAFRFHCMLIIISIVFQLVAISCGLASDVKIIVHADIEDPLSANDIRNIFLGKKTQWEDSQRIRFVLYTEKDIYRKFIKQYVRKTLYQYRNYWRKKVFTGTGMMPVMYNKCTQCIDFVKRTKGAISFVPETCTVSDGVREISKN